MWCVLLPSCEFGFVILGVVSVFYDYAFQGLHVNSVVVAVLY